MDWEQQQILLTTTNCLILPVVGPYELISKIFNFQENPEEKQEVDSFVNSLKSSMRNKMFSMLLEEAEKEAEDEPVLRSNYRYVVL